MAVTPAALRSTDVRLAKPLAFWATKSKKVEEMPADSPDNSDSPNVQIGLRLKGNNWNYRTELSALAVRLGHDVADLPSLKKALEPERVRTSNISAWDKADTEYSSPSRLSFMGKSALQLFLSEYLHYTYPVMTGSMLQDLAQSLVNIDSLCELAKYVGVTDLIQARRDSPLWSNAAAIADIFCAVVGAVYHDAGSKAARKVVHDLLVPQLVGKDLEVVVKMEHPRLMLHSILAAQKRPLSSSRLISESGRATHFPSFRVGVYSENDLLGEGTGTSLRRAEKEAMLTALRSHFIKEVAQSSLPSDMEDYKSEKELREKMCSDLEASTQTQEASNS